MILNKRPEILSKEQLTRKMKLMVALRRRTYLKGPHPTNRTTKRNEYHIKKIVRRQARRAREKFMAGRRASPMSPWLVKHQGKSSGNAAS